MNIDRGGATLIFINRFYRPDESATSQMLTDIAEQLAARGVAVRIVCSRQLYEDAGARLASAELLNGVEVRRIWTTRFGRRGLLGRAFDYLTFYLSAAVALCWMLRRGDILVAKTDPPMISIVAGATARLRGAILVNWLQDIFPEVASKLAAVPMPGVFLRPLQALRNQSLRQARINIVLGERMAQYVTPLAGRSDIRILENWADATAIAPLPPASSSLRRSQQLEESFVVGYSGNLGRAHEYETILEAAWRLRSLPDIVFLFVGGGAGLAALRSLAAQRGLTNFRFLPYQPRALLADSLAAADVHLACLLPELEGLIVPSKTYGVLAAGRPLLWIGDPRGEVAQVVSRNQCGAAIECGDDQALADEILRLRADVSEREAMGRRARVAFEQHYSLDCAVHGWIDLLQSLRIPVTQVFQDAR